MPAAGPAGSSMVTIKQRASLTTGLDKTHCVICFVPPFSGLWQQDSINLPCSFLMQLMSQSIGRLSPFCNAPVHRLQLC